TQFLYDGLNPVQELSGVTPVANVLTTFGIDEYLARADNSGTAYFVTDALGSTLALTDGTGALTTTYGYSPFGATTVNGSPSDNPFAYTGRENDGSNGLYFHRAPYFHPQLQRFIHQDPIGFQGRDVNLYAYVQNRPINATDPMGLWAPAFHKEMSGEVAKDCGMSPADAEALAKANRAMDFSLVPLPSLSTVNPW